MKSNSDKTDYTYIIRLYRPSDPYTVMGDDGTIGYVRVPAEAFEGGAPNLDRRDQLTEATRNRLYEMFDENAFSLTWQHSTDEQRHAEEEQLREQLARTCVTNL